MRVIVNRYIPFRGFVAINLLGVVLVRRNRLHCFDAEVRRHEAIHTAQMRELGYVGFYLLYVVEYLFRLLLCRSRIKAYRSISFEAEAYARQGDCTYLGRRPRWAFLAYMRHVRRGARPR